ncbi:3-carboxyethylcatechol 2,3-dioxygenase [Paraburkholderia sp. BR10937]|uniref:3-carboxyethylcatechol 2,3-dioxygenase n=1 Tax=Paraburkholderia sp. BR10937 TaxID=3236994 RepID=UPI0034D2DF59
MSILVECMSHTPLQGHFDPAPEIVADVRDVTAAARERVRAFNPELVVVFAPDHFNGFFYDLMPPFCVGAAASGVGDYGTPVGDLLVPADIARRMVESVLAADIDVSISYRMQVDHGAAQALEHLIGGLDTYPVVPVFINAAAPPLGTLRRSRLLGEAIGHFLRQTGKRVLVIGSGGISHEPPVPELVSAPKEVAEALIAGRNLTPEARAMRQERVFNAAKAFTAGEAPNMRALNPEWDQAFLARLQNDLLSVDAMNNDEIARDGGKSAHEIRTWVAAFGALSAFGKYDAHVDYYCAIPQWIAGYAFMHAQTAA